jgi:phenylacetate-CoA ligase
MEPRLSADPDDLARYPTLGDAGQRMLQFLREHPAAPLYRNQSGNRLTATEVAELHAFEAEVLNAAVGWPRGGQPEWLDAFVERAFADVPYYRALGSPPRRFSDIPTVSRAEFAADIARFVPDSAPIERLINFRTTGTTGHALLIASQPAAAARYLGFHKRALARFGVTLEHGAGQVGVVLIGHQRHCFTYVSVTPTMGESGLAKINLHPDDWRDPEHRAQYLDALAPEVIAGDPISFAVLADLPVTTRPKALISVSMTLLPGLRQRLEARFGCQVLDIYSMNEAGPVAVYDPALSAHVLLQPSMYVEILDRDGNAAAEGTRGEITLTGGFNDCLPLVRYRTGDYAALAQGPDAPMLLGLSGRPPVRFRNAAGTWHNNIDVTHALAGLALAQFGLHQDARGALTLRLPAHAMDQSAAVRTALAALFGSQPIAVAPIAAEDKIVQYTSELAGAVE